MYNKLIYDLKIFKGKRKKEINYDKLSKILDDLSDEQDAACRGLDDFGNFSNSIIPEEHGYIDLTEVSENFPNFTFELTYVSSDGLNVYKTIYKNGEQTFKNGKIVFND